MGSERCIRDSVVSADLKPVVLPAEGLVISRTIADILGLRSGDMVEVEVLEGRRQKLMQPISAIVTGYIGLTGFMDLDAMNLSLIHI